MKNLLLLLLSLVPCRADLISSFTASISGNLADGTPFSASGDCGMMTVEAASTYCLSSVDYGQVDLIIHAAGSGPEGGPNLFASVSGTAGFTDSVTFTGQSGDGVVAWAMDSHPSPSADVPLMLPTAITFGASYPISIMVSDSVGASTGADETTATDFINMLGFRVFSTACDAELTLYGTVYDPAQCGTPLNVGIETASGFTYPSSSIPGGFPAGEPEPASAWMLLGAIGAAVLAFLFGRSRVARAATVAASQHGLTCGLRVQDDSIASQILANECHN